jgi:uncharacterized membrane protein (DUF2068 family)
VVVVRLAVERLVELALVARGVAEHHDARAARTVALDRFEDVVVHARGLVDDVKQIATADAGDAFGVLAP